MLVDSFIDNIERPPMLIIELDSTDDPAHGQQQLIGFNGFHSQWMYHPLVIHEGVTGCILGTVPSQREGPGVCSANSREVA